LTPHARYAFSVGGEKIDRVVLTHVHVRDHQVLMSPKLQLVTQLGKRVDPADYSTIAQTLVKIFEANGKAMDLLEWAIRQEISSSGTPASRALGHALRCELWPNPKPLSCWHR
jgi:hypothetical protein